MPRRNRPRSIGREDALARRIGYERDQRGWSYAGLASRMSNAGCPIDQSALYKIEHATPRRRISVDELVALSRVFALSLDDLLVPPEIVADRQAVHLLQEYRAAREAAEDAWFSLARHAASHPRVEQLLEAQMTEDDLSADMVNASLARFRQTMEANDAQHQQAR